MITAVLMRLPDPGGAVRTPEEDGVLTKAGFNPDEPRDERGRWTNSESVQENDNTNNAQAGAHEVFWQKLGSELSEKAKSLLSGVGQAELDESDAYLSAATNGLSEIAEWLRDYEAYRSKPWIGFDGRVVQVPTINTGDRLADRAVLMGHALLSPNAPVMRPGTNADWINPLINLISAGATVAGSAFRAAPSAAEALEGGSASANVVDKAFATTDGVTVTGARAIDRAVSYEVGVRNLYEDIPYSERQFQAFVDGQWIAGVADGTTLMDGQLTAIDAKYVEDWGASLRNPASEFGNEPWSVSEQLQMVRQAKVYSSGFPGGVVYHTNSVDLATFYTDTFQRAGITNFRFLITPVSGISKMMSKNSMERILGAFEHERQIAGTRPGEHDTVRYVSFSDPASVPNLFNAVGRQIEPPLLKWGGIVLEGTRLKLPDGQQFFAVVFHGDIEGWQKQIEGGAKELGRVTAIVQDGNILTSDGRSCPLSSCEIEFADIRPST